MNWHKRLTAAREAKGIKKSAFAKMVGVSPPTVTDWENGETKMIEGANLVKVCSLLGITSQWLIDGDESFSPASPPTIYDRVDGRNKTAPMVELGLLTEREARLLDLFRMCTEDSKGILEISAQALEKLPLLSIGNDKTQRGTPRS